MDRRPGLGPERAGASEDTHPPGRRERAITQSPARLGLFERIGDPRPLAPADAQLVGTMAEKALGRLSHPSTIWLTWTYTLVPAFGTP